MKNFIETQEAELKTQFGYIFRCDDKKAPKEIKPDTYFRLWEFEKVSETVKLFEKLKLNYDLVIEEFNINNDVIYCQMNIKNTNWKNDN
tara:strand:+ start:313 stop:579 length:267 start_codon:yes stop_codon:yes gene_type:complete